MVKPAACRQAVGLIQAELKLSQRLACRALGVSRGSMRYQSVRPVPTALLKRTVVDTSFSGARLARLIDSLGGFQGLPPVVCDNGPEFISKALDIWAAEHNVTLSLIQPGKPTQNAFIETSTSGYAPNA